MLRLGSLRVRGGLHLSKVLLELLDGIGVLARQGLDFFILLFELARPRLLLLRLGSHGLAAVLVEEVWRPDGCWLVLVDEVGLGKVRVDCCWQYRRVLAETGEFETGWCGIFVIMLVCHCHSLNPSHEEICGMALAAQEFRNFKFRWRAFLSLGYFR